MRAPDQTAVEEQLALVESERQPEQAERLLLGVVGPLLEAEGYSVEHTGGPGDRGIDFLAVQQAPTQGLPSRVGVQYKHSARPVGAETVEQVIRASAANRLHRMLLVSRSGFSESARGLLARALPTEVELLDLPFLRAWLKRLAGESEPVLPSAAQAITELGGLLARIIARTPSELHSIEWRDLERMIAEIFSKLGFSTTLTPSAKDGGKDVVVRFTAEGEQRSFIVEAKHWRSGKRVGAGCVTDFVQVVAREQHDGGLILSTAGYTENAFETITAIERQILRAGDRTKIVALCRTFVRAEAGLFAMPTDPASVLADDTLDIRTGTGEGA